jgi:hypothetical protein
VGRSLPDVRRELSGGASGAAAAPNEPLAEVLVRLFGLDVGNAEVQIWAASDGDLAAVQSAGPEQAAALERLRALVDRELGEACRCMGGGAHSHPAPQ